MASESYQGIPSFDEWFQLRQDYTTFSEFMNTDPQQARDFVYGCNEIKGKFQTINPDIAFFPERGAMPIAWSLEELWFDPSTKSRQMYRQVFLPIGTKVEPSRNVWSGISNSQKHDIITRTVSDLHNQGIEVRNPVLVDEVQSGGTLSTVATDLHSVLKDTYGINQLHVIAAKDNRSGQIRAKKLRQMIAQRFDELPTSTTLLPLFFIDKVNLLDIIVEDDPQNNTFNIKRNGLAESIIKLITQVALLKNNKRIKFLQSEIVNGIEMNPNAQQNFSRWLEQIASRS